jgi:hypothetical protein
MSADIYSLGAIIYFLRNGQDPVYLRFDKCGYPIFPNRLEDYGHTSIMGRMMCQRPEERLKLDEMDFCGFTKEHSCAICNQKLDGNFVDEFLPTNGKATCRESLVAVIKKIEVSSIGIIHIIYYADVGMVFLDGNRQIWGQKFLVVYNFRDKRRRSGRCVSNE